MAPPDWSKGRVLGRGSTATVNLASSSRTGDLFAVKWAPLSTSSSLRRERAILSSLRPSKHIVSYLGYDVSDAHYNLFLEYAPGGSLSGKLADPTIRSRTRDILTGLSFLHSSGVVHCDVKSRNVLIAADGQAKIADFGCAKFVDESRPIGGTPMFMAPEVARGEDQGPPADVWAVGCVVIEMATGRAPWPQESDAIAVLHRIAFSDDVPDAPEWMSEEGKDFLSRCFRRDPEERPTAEQLLAHPFLLNSGNNWTSPKSILDQHIWESMEEEEEESAAAEPNACAVESRSAIAELAGSSGPNWTWDDEWLTIRTGGDGNEEEVQETEQQIADNDNNEDDSIILDTDTDTESVGSVGADSSINLVNVTANCVTDCDNVGYYSDDEFISSNNSNENKNVIVFRSGNWIYAVIPVGSSLLSFAICCVVSCAFMAGSAQKSNQKKKKNEISKEKHILMANFNQWEEESHKRGRVSNHVYLVGSIIVLCFQYFYGMLNLLPFFFYFTGDLKCSS